jgi:hypothetical protein
MYTTPIASRPGRNTTESRVLIRTQQLRLPPTGFLASFPHLRGKPLRLHDGRYECAHCGTILDIPLAENPLVTMQARSGQPNVRVLKFEGREIHRCEIGAHDRVR